MERACKKKLFALLPHAVICYFVSDRAKALINLATVIHKVTSVADCFHFKYCINRLLCLALASKLRCAKSGFSNALMSNATNVPVPEAEKYAQVQFYTDMYVESMQNISYHIHPFFHGNVQNTSERAGLQIDAEMANIEQVVEGCQINDKYNLLLKAQQQLPDVVAVINQWHKIKDGMVLRLGLCQNKTKWFKSYLLPKIYWETMLKRTRHKPTRDIYKNELSMIETNNTLDIQLNKTEIEKLQYEAIEICRKFQRASSQVEGRNGFLSAINHNQRSFDKQRLGVLTVVHNFDTKGEDGKAPAQRLFGKYVEFDNLFEFIIDNFGDLPANRSRKTTG